jgi:hypothetical protein
VIELIGSHESYKDTVLDDLVVSLKEERERRRRVRVSGEA